MAQDLTELITYYQDHWKKSKVMLVGYSFGADVLPFAVNRLPEELRKMVSHLVQIAPYRHAQFEVTLMSYLTTPQHGELVLPELQKLKVGTVFTVCDDDQDALCQDMEAPWDYITMEGGHHFDGAYDRLNRLIGQKVGLE